MSHTGTILYMCTVPGKPHHRKLTAPLKYVKFGGDVGLIPVGFEWDGSSVPWIFQRVFPRHRHPIASCRHDWRCRHAKSREERLFADQEFRRDVRTTSWWITAQVGYIGVRVGAYLGIGKYHKY